MASPSVVENIKNSLLFIELIFLYLFIVFSLIFQKKHTQLQKQTCDIVFVYFYFFTF
jgi:hypothetical protein